MKLLLDENLSDRIVENVADLFPGSSHVKSEGLAHAEIARKYGVTFICLAGGCRPGVPCPAFGVIFLVASIGDTPGGDPGFAMSDSDALEFMENDAVCRAKRAVFRAQPDRVSNPPKSVGSVYSRHSPAPRDPRPTAAD